MRITQYDGLYGETMTGADGEYLFSELIETRSRTFDWIIQPHIHARLLQVFLVLSGRVEFKDASRTRQLEGPCLLLIPPTALHGFVYSADVTGHILTLSDTWIDGLFPASSGVASMLGHVQCLTVFDGAYSPQTVQELIRHIDDELFDDRPEKRGMVQACLQRLFIVLYRIWQQNHDLENRPDDPYLRYFRAFQQRIRQVGGRHSIGQFADELAVSPVHLNRICQAVAGKSALQLVQEHRLNEARKYLLYTSYTVSEIAYLLEFDYPNYFARFFRKHTGLSPTDYRASTNQRV
ncbi:MULTISPECIES: helix-turn-helix domain-containing protein [Spirosoma]|uniref:Helix-turn-helix domain-containing protein n=1 Tax=Spirosoma sordidisoli TaxID=2502893 RepID=A0A4Q2UNC8_9BACT|nr:MULTISPECIES: helix-turn-helix domain-containing protein [Spirosoma]RYC69271.1 helix-turn-helix domain-containing protein [Spirosoma sordidisoli]